jgi:hypothetical protein
VGGSTIGAFVVIVASTAILVTGAMNGSAGITVWCAAAAATGRACGCCSTSASSPSWR